MPVMHFGLEVISQQLQDESVRSWELSPKKH